MTTHDQACFELWLEKYATPEEQALPFSKQIEEHILWLSGYDKIDLESIEIPPSIRERPT